MTEYRETGALPPQVEVRTPSKEEVLAIYRRAWGREASPNFNPDNLRIVRCGRKELLLSLGYDQGSTLLVARPEEEAGEALPGETTAAYQEVKRLMEEHARTLPVPYTYTLTTENEKNAGVGADKRKRSLWMGPSDCSLDVCEIFPLVARLML